MLIAVFEHMRYGMPETRSGKLTLFKKLMMAMLRLRLNSRLQELPFQFEVSISTVSRVPYQWITAIDVRLQHLIYWPEHEESQRTMQTCFVQSFGKKGGGDHKLF